MIDTIPAILIIGGAVLLSLYLANVFYDYGVPQYISRKVGHLGGCVGFLLCPIFFSSFLWPIIITAAFAAALLCARYLRPSTFRGVGGAGRVGAVAEINFPLAGIITIGILWGVMGQPWLAIVPLLFMGAGDAVTGLIRSAVYGKEVKGAWGSLGMVLTCLVLASLITPYWIGVFGAITATGAEKWTKTTRFIDDNITIPLSSALVMGILSLGAA